MVYVIISTQIWTDNWVSKHWIADHLASRGNEIYFLEPLRAVFPKKGGRLKDLFFGPKLSKAGNVNVVSFSSFPAYWRFPARLKSFARFFLKKQFKNFNKLLQGREYVLITFDGRSLPFIDMLHKPKVSAYYCVDPVGAGQEFGAGEYDLVSRVDKVFAISEACKNDIVSSHGRNDVQVVPHGIVTDKRMLKESGVDFRFDLKIIEEKKETMQIVGYTGSIHDLYVDFDKLLAFADSNRDVFWVFVGPYRGSDIAADSSSKIKKMLAHPQMLFLGSRPYWSLSSYIELFDVCIIPYRSDLDNGWVRRSPVKILHYLLQGKPVVCANVPGVSAYSGLIWCYDDYVGFVDGMKAALASSDELEAAEERKRFALSRDSNNILDLILERLG